jgi:hypothetical protein
MTYNLSCASTITFHALPELSSLIRSSRVIFDPFVISFRAFSSSFFSSWFASWAYYAHAQVYFEQCGFLDFLAIALRCTIA